MYILDRFGRKIQLADIRAVERLEQLKKKHGNNPWPAIEECFKIWESKHPTRWDAHLIHIDNIKESRLDKKFASHTNKETGATIRYTLDVPDTVLKMVRMVYSSEELPMDREFWLAFAKKFPKLKVANEL
jgi:hypothetical protein